MARVDPLEQLFEHTWKDVPFPATSFRMVLRHDLAIHKFVKRDGASVEGTGRAPLEFTASIPFFNDIDPGPRESWVRGSLYPDGWRRFIAVCSEMATGYLQQPEIGRIKCKLEHCETDWSFSARGGVTVNATWLETVEDDSDFAELIASVSPVASAIEAGADIDRHLSELTPPLPKLPVYEPTFESFMRSIQGVFDQQTLLTKRITGTIDNAVYRVNAVLGAMDASNKAPGAAVQHVRNWPLRDACSRMKSACNDVKSTLMSGNRKIGIYVPAQSATLAMVAVDAKSNIGDLMRLNPSLITRPIVPAYTKVRYFLAA